ncbi:YbaB/EbfC family nucleoid-associated protein [candidate division WOR-3 bacterium]|nr:YbaB/EbfC family nucleoid-associated protein [candidate division WOR-3 bacterium]
MQNFDRIIKQAQKMQADIDRIQKELAQENFEGESGGGIVKAVVDGTLNPVSVKIEKEILKSEEVEMIEDLIVAAFTAAQRKAKNTAQEKMKGMYGPLDLPKGLW